MKIKYIIPFPLTQDKVEKRAAQIPQDLIRPDVVIEFIPVRNSAFLADSLYEGLLLEMFIFEAGMRSEEEGYDAVCIDTASDSGMQALRSRLSIPVIGPGLVGCHIASMLGRKFSIISLFERWNDNCKRNMIAYQMIHKVASFRSLSDVQPDVANLMDGKEELVYPQLENLCLKAINEDGADAIVMASTTMHQAVNYLKDRLPVPVINPGIWGVRIAIDMVDLGISHSKRAYPSPGKLQDEIWSSLPSAQEFQPVDFRVVGLKPAR